MFTELRQLLNYVQTMNNTEKTPLYLVRVLAVFEQNIALFFQHVKREYGCISCRFIHLHQKPIEILVQTTMMQFCVNMFRICNKPQLQVTSAVSLSVSL